MDDLSGKQIGRFEVRGRIGAGGMGEVYSAWDPQLKRKIAIKRLVTDAETGEEWRQRLLREARSAARITNQHVAALYDVVESDDELFVIMELVEGDTLRSLDLPLDTDDFLDVAKQCASGLAAAHAQGIVHGDIKPHNIMVNQEGEAKILDFGVAGFIDPAGGDAETVADTLAVSPGEAGYTVGYASPEVLKGKPADTRADLFSLGVVFYELLTGLHPFAAENSNAMIGRVLHEEPPPLEELNRQVNPALSHIVSKLLAKERRGRYATADDLLVDLRAALTQHDTGRAMGRRARGGGTARPSMWVGVALAVAVLGVLTAPFWSRYLPFGNSTAPATRFDASEWIIAVLPSSEYADEEEEMHSLNDGLATTLTAGLTRLSQAHELQVVPASSLFERQALTPAAARREFGVTLALTFTTQQFGDTVRVTANLIDIRAERQLAAETIDGPSGDLLALQERVTRQVLRMLSLELRPLEQDYLAAGTEEPRAYAYYVRGLGYLENRTADDLEAARELFEQALRIDSEFAAAHARLGETLWHRYVATLEPSWMDEARQACTTATELDEFDASGHVCLGWVLLETGQADEAVGLFERGIDLDPTRDDAFRGLANAQEALNRTDLAEQTYRDAIAMRPHYWNGYRMLAVFLYNEGRYDEAIESFEEVVTMAPDSFAGFSDLGAAYYQAERWAESRRALSRALELNPEDALATTNLGTLEFYEHDFARAAELFDRAVALRPRDSIAWGNLAETLALLGNDPARAAAALERALELTAAELEVNPNFPWTLADRALYLARAGDAAAFELFSRARQEAGDDPEILLIGARAAQELGDADRALDLLELSLAGGTSRLIVERDPTFDALRGHPRWSSLMAAGNPGG